MGKKLGFSDKQIRAGAAARDRASKSTPKAVVDAFLPDQILAGNLPLNPVTMSTIIALQKINSPLLKTENASALDIASIAEALFIMTQPIVKVRGLIVSGGFRTAVDRMADEIPVALLPPIGELLNKHLPDAFSTAIPYGPKDRTDSSSPFPEGRTQGPATDGSQP